MKKTDWPFLIFWLCYLGFLALVGWGLIKLFL